MSTITAERLRDFTATLQKYKAGKASLERRVVAAENWWKLRNRFEEQRRGLGDDGGFRSESGWLHNVIVSKHADAMEAYPEPLILPREPGDAEQARLLSAILPCILEQNRFEQVYDQAMWQKLKTGTACYRVVWDPEKHGGLGDIAIERVDLLNLFWEPGVSDIQRSRYFFCTHLEDEESLCERWPQLRGRLRSNPFLATRFVYDDAVSLEGKATVIEVYYKKRGALHYCKYVGDTVLYATEDAECGMRSAERPGPDPVRLAADAVPGPGLSAQARQRRGCGTGEPPSSATGSGGSPVILSEAKNPPVSSAQTPTLSLRASAHTGVELQPCAAGGRRSKAAISAAVGKRKDPRKPAAFSGHRKAEIRTPGGQPEKETDRHTSAAALVRDDSRYDPLAAEPSEAGLTRKRKKEGADGEFLPQGGNGPERVSSDAGLYAHGQYPFVFDPLFPVEGSPCGYGFVDLCANAQTSIDLLRTAFVRNALVGATPRYFERIDGSVNEEEFLDLSRPVVHVSGNLGEDSLRQIGFAGLPGIYVSVLESTIRELRETSGNTETANGTMNVGVTAASAIAALQEASGKGSRDATRASYGAFARIVELCIELIREFYTLPRQFRITGAMGDGFVDYTNLALRPRPLLAPDGETLGMTQPVFDVKVSAQKRSAYSRLSQNEMAMELYRLGMFEPGREQQALGCLELMDFDGRESLRERLLASMGLREKLGELTKYKALALALAKRYRPDLALGLLGGPAGAMIGRESSVVSRETVGEGLAPPADTAPNAEDLSLRTGPQTGVAIRSPLDPVSLPGEAPAAERGRRAAAEAVRP